MSGPIVRAQLDHSDCLWRPVIQTDEGEVQISIGYETYSKAIDFGRRVYDDYRRLLAMKRNTPSPSADLAVDPQLQEAPHAI